MSIPTLVVIVITCMLGFVAGYFLGRFGVRKVEGTLYITDTPEMTSYNINVNSFEEIMHSDFVVLRVERHNKGV